MSNLFPDPMANCGRPDRTPSAVHSLHWDKIWDPEEQDKTNPQNAIKKYLATKNFAKDPASYVATSVIGSVANLPTGRLNACAVSAALVEAGPQIAKNIEANPKASMITLATGGTVLDGSSIGINDADTRMLIVRLRAHEDDELRARFGEYVARSEKAIKRTGATLLTHERGKARPTGPLSDIRYEFGERSGFVRSVVVRGYEESDDEFSRMIVQEEGHSLFGGSADTAKRMLARERGRILWSS